MVTARRRDLPGCTGLALLARAQALTATDAEAASGLAAAARDALNGAGMALDAARAALVNATALAAHGDREQASAQARAAQSAFEFCGAGPFARKAASRSGVLRVAAQAALDMVCRHPIGPQS